MGLKAAQQLLRAALQQQRSYRGKIIVMWHKETEGFNQSDYISNIYNIGYIRYIMIISHSKQKTMSGDNETLSVVLNEYL